IVFLSSGVRGVPRCTMTRIISSHSGRDDRTRVTCPISWQIAHFAWVSSAPGPGTSGSCAVAEGASAASAHAAAPARSRLRLVNDDSHARHGVPEVSEGVPGRHLRLRVALVISRARDDEQLAGRVEGRLEGEAPPGVLVAAGREPRRRPGLTAVERELDAVDGVLTRPRRAADE